MDDEKKDRMLAFVKDLEEISRKHGFAIDGCGCCGSPAIIDLPSKGEYIYRDDGTALVWDDTK